MQGVDDRGTTELQAKVFQVERQMQQMENAHRTELCGYEVCGVCGNEKTKWLSSE